MSFLCLFSRRDAIKLNSCVCVYVFSSVGVKMASDDVANLADSLAKTQVDEGELSYKGQGLKLDNAQSGELTMLS